MVYDMGPLFLNKVLNYFWRCFTGTCVPYLEIRPDWIVR